MTGKCPMCGYQEVVEGKLVHTIMNEYVNEKTGKIVCLNSMEKKIEIKDEDGNVKSVLIRKDLYTADSSKSVEVAPVIKNRLEELPPIGETPKPNPFANVKPPTP